MTHTIDNHTRRSHRLKDYDYASLGAYFVTICTKERRPFFDHPDIRSIAERCWLEIPRHHSGVDLDTWVIMPDHVHGIVWFTGAGVQLNAPTTRRNPTAPYSTMSPTRDSLGTVIRTFKAAVTTLCRRGGFADFGWQRSYYDRVIRDERELERTREYIEQNPLQP